jgi:hypothetical protein
MPAIAIYCLYFKTQDVKEISDIDQIQLLGEKYPCNLSETQRTTGSMPHCDSAIL